jgi:hypothetical protein
MGLGGRAKSIGSGFGIGACSLELLNGGILPPFESCTSLRTSKLTNLNVGAEGPEPAGRAKR